MASDRRYLGTYSKQDDFIIAPGKLTTFMVALDTNNISYSNPPAHWQYTLDVVA